MVDPAKCRLRIDSPRPLCATDGGMRLIGWCFDESTASVPEARIVVGGNVYACESKLPRPDVAAAFPQWPQAEQCGFRLDTWMPAGYATAHLELSTDGANW